MAIAFIAAQAIAHTAAQASGQWSDSIGYRQEDKLKLDLKSSYGSV